MQGTDLPQYKETIAAQSIAAAPEKSAWVAANAGAGKTKVLTDRVMRLLLTGVPPAKILSITFTKAAAAEMAERLFGRLGKWALMPDDALRKELQDLDGLAHDDAADLSVARGLFAAALETPGGLKIQTIHSFCESVLKRFPLEAGIPPGFTVMEELEASTVMHSVLNAYAGNIWENEAERDDFFQLTEELTSDTLIRSLRFLTEKSAHIRQAVQEAGGTDGFFAQLASFLNIDSDTDVTTCRGDYLDQVDWDYLQGAYSALLAGGPKDVEGAARLKVALDEKKAEDIFEALRTFYLTKDNALRKTIAYGAAEKVKPGLNETLKTFGETYVDTWQYIQTVETFITTKRLYNIAFTIIADYEHCKKERGLLDFYDLIEKTAKLFSAQASSADWVLYKLDRGIEHILVDEAQDTSDGQWRVIEKPLQEFFAGLNAREDMVQPDEKPVINRTVFVVGDEKQSIYSFQGADVALFQQKQGELQERVSAVGAPMEVLNLALSFRSTEPVLKYVDELFTPPDIAVSFTEEKMVHTSFRQGDAGLVEHWPLVPKPEKVAGNPWDAPVDRIGQDDPVRVLARHISATLKGWIGKEELASKGRKIRPSDIMILCQRRGPIFHELVRQLTINNVPTAGADRVKLLEDTAVKDMLAAIRFVLQTKDDLSLAEVLKSPLYGFDDEMLFDIAYDRRGSLWAALRARAGDKGFAWQKQCDFAATELAKARSIAMLKGPYAFLSFLLENGTPSGWRRMFGRLGKAAEEPLQEILSEALQFDVNQPRSLQLFLDRLERLDTDLKKEIDGSDDLVRIMTVHGSKGLEANIVFLADADYLKTNTLGSFMPIGEKTSEGEMAIVPGYFVKATSKELDNDALSLARADALGNRAEESRRLLYVAATRARDRLYICGVHRGQGGIDSALKKVNSEASWHTLSARAFERLGEQGSATKSDGVPWAGDVWRLETMQSAEIKEDEKQAGRTDISLPGWLSQSAQSETAPKRLLPSKLSDTEAGDIEIAIADDNGQITALTPSQESAVYAPRSVPTYFTPYTRGNALHLLLEKLPDMPPEKRAAAAIPLLLKEVPDLSAALQEEWRDEVLTVLEDRAFADVFGKGSKAEVSVMGRLDDGALISGQIDRLVVTDNQVLIVDYKTNRPPPTDVKDTPLIYVRQVAAYRRLMSEIYPNRPINCALLWTWEARLMPIPVEMLDHAFVQ